VRFKKIIGLDRVHFKSEAGCSAPRGEFMILT
jgi:hypothetical protein